MIVTLTMNPALDIATEIDTIAPTHKMRCGTPRYDPGGGGVNVARVARTLGARVCAIFPSGGPTGQSLCQLLSEAGVPTDRVPIAESTRESFTVTELRTRHQYRFVLPGPRLSRAEQDACLERLSHAAAAAQFVVASGSLPPGVPDNFYQQVAEVCADVQAPLILDSCGGGLLEFRGSAFLLKPSVRELRDFLGSELASEGEQVAAARSLIDAGRAENVVVSLGGDGALMVTAHGAQRFPPIELPHGSGVGAGDAMVAGIAVGLCRGWALEKAVRLGNAAGAAMLLTPGTAVCRRADVDRLFSAAPDPVAIC